MSEGPQPPEPPEPLTPPGRPTSHRATTPVSDSVRRFLAPLAAVTAVVVVIVLLLVLNGPGRHSGGTSPALQPPPTVTTTSASPAAVRTTPAPAPRKPSHRATPRRTPAARKPPASATSAAQKLPVTVLNNSRRTGLAHRAADQLTAGGWPIRQVGNFTGRIPVSTVYYAAGQEPAAQALARQFPAVQRVHPRFSGLPGSGLTLVVTREWPAASS